MPLFTPYFSLDSSAFRVGNGGRLRCRMGASGIGIYVMLLSHLRDCRDCRAPLDYDMLAFDLHEDAAAVRRVVEDFGLFDIDRSSGTFTSSVLTTVRGMLSDDASAAVGGTTRTVRQRRVRSAGETYRRAVRRLAEDNALPPAEEEAAAEGDAEPAEEVPTSSPNAITPAEGEHPFAEEANATGAFAPASIAAEGTPAEVKHESADAEGTPAEVEDQPAEKEDATGDFADAHSPRTEEKRKEQNKKPHTPIVPFPQSGKGTRASHPTSAVVGEREEGAASSEGNEESVEGNPLSVPSTSAERDAPPCAASPTVLGAPAPTLNSHPSTDTEKGTTSMPNGKSSAENKETSTNHSQPNPLTASEKTAHSQANTANGTTSVPNGQTSAENKEMSTNHSQPNLLTASEKTTHPDPDAANGTTSVPNGESSAENKEMSTNHSQPNSLTASEKTTHQNPDTANPNGRDTHPSGKMPNRQTSMPNGQMSAENKEMGTNHSQPNPLTASEKTAHPQANTANGTTSVPNPNERDTHPSGKMQNGTSSVPNGQTSAEKEEMSTNHSQPNPLTASEKTAHPNPDAANGTTSTANPNERDTHPSGKMQNGTTSVPNGQTSAEKGETSTNHSQPNTLTASEETAHPQTDRAKADTSMPNSQTDTANSPTSTTDAQPNALTTSEKGDEAGRGEEGAGEPFVPPTANEVRRFAEALRHPEFDAEWFVAYYSERHWRRHNGRPVVSWQTTARYWLDHPLRVARHLLGHRPAASPVSVGVGGPSAVVVPAAGATAAKPVGTSTYPVAASASSPSTGTPPVGTGGLSPRSSASPVGTGTPHVGSLSLPAPTPLQQSRLSDLKGMVLHLFADAPAAAPTSATTAPDLSSAAADVSTSVPTPATAASPSVRPARFISPAEAAQVIAQQTLAAAEAEAVSRVGERRATDSEEEARIGEISPADAAKAIDAQVLSPADAKEYVRSCHDSTDEDGEEARVGEISPANATKAIDAQVLSPADAEESVRACDNSTDEDEEDALNGHDSTTDTAKDIDSQVLSPADAEEDALNGHDSTTNAAKGIDALPFSADKGRWGIRSPRGPDPPTGDGHDSTDTGNDFADVAKNFTSQPSNFSADRHSPAAVGTALVVDPPIFAADECRPLRTLTEKHPYLNPSFHEPHPLLRLHPPSIGGFGRTFRVQSAQPPFGRPFLGRFVDIRPACTVGSRPLRPRLTLCRTERGRCRLEPPDRECTTSANAIRPPEDGHEHGIDGCKRHDPAPEHPADTVEHGTDGRKNADFIDADPTRGHKTERNAAEHAANAVSTPADGHEHDARRAKNADFIDADPVRGHKIDRNAPEHTADERKRHDSADEHTADECPDPAYDPDAGQRLLDTAAHRRAVRAEREACCGALRHLAHCCVAF